MDTILSIALWGGLIFLMMRFGCGSHMFGHRHGAEHKDGSGNNPHGSKNAGCCGGGEEKHVHSSAGNTSSENAHLRWTPPPEDIDPVCGIAVSTTDTKSCIHDGWVHYFCSSKCRDMFEASPGIYLENIKRDNVKQLS